MAQQPNKDRTTTPPKTNNQKAESEEKKHKKRHVKLHRCLDELFADYIFHHKNENEFIHMEVGTLLTWSYEQTKNPTVDKKR